MQLGLLMFLSDKWASDTVDPGGQSWVPFLQATLRTPLVEGTAWGLEGHGIGKAKAQFALARCSGFSASLEIDS